ncbi:hypothetical protein [Yersinia pseudotuberculosis]|uniref:hypothetical protein n=1 Tax=Yersinia pseudotuberculosis TaxID=633 RepID=UPI0005E612B1|nr:hypothetical protein [Yersinia pseudotuberculosis]CNL05087.1 Uncharacterised protein [Yersinia pseudotuberculosis]
MTDGKTQIISNEELIDTIFLHTKEIDFTSLENEGILVKEGAWYRVSKWGLVREFIRKRVTSISQDKKGLKVKISKPSKEMLRLAAKFTKS